MSSEPAVASTDIPTGSLAGVGSTRLTNKAGLNRFVWNMEYAGPWSPSPRQNGRNGPLAAPGKYTVRMTSGGNAESRSLTILPDPRVVRDGVTTDVMKQQLAHNLKVRDLLSEANIATARLVGLKRQPSASAEARQKVATVESVLLTPTVRYSKPGLQSQIQYLYTETIGADQQVGRDAIDRYKVLRVQLDSAKKQISEVHIP